MLVDERREQIRGIAEKMGFVSLQELADEVGVSESTVRRDLEHLDGIGQIRRTRGGAVYVGEGLHAFEERVSKALNEKRRIARAVAELIEPGEAILLDGGTTTLEVARQLHGRPLHVVTNSLPIVNALATDPNVELVFVGGYVYPNSGVALGPLTVEALSRINARRLVMGVGGITERGLYNGNTLLVETERQMMAAAEEVIVVADSSKFDHTALAHLCTLDKVDRFVVDKGLSPVWRNRIDRAGAELIVAD